jgi:predicted nucleotidyltransferase
MSPVEKHIAEMIKAKVKQKDPSAEVVVFGSHARAEASKDSDWDILILLNRPDISRALEKEFRDEVFEVELEIGQPISTFVFSKIAWETKHSVTPLYQNIQREGILL